MKALKTFFVVALSFLWTTAAGALPLAASEEPVRQCVADLCGSTKFLVNATGSGDFSRFQPRDVKLLFNDSLKPVMNEIMDLEMDRLRKIIDLWPHLESRFKTETLNEEQKILLSVVKFTNVDFDKIQVVFEYKGGRIWVNQAKWKELEPQRSTESIRATSQFIEILFNSDQVNAASDLDGTSYDFALKLLDLETPEALQAWSGRMATKAFSRLINLGPFLVSRSDIEPLQKLSRGEELDSYEKTTFVHTVAQLFRQDAFFEDPSMREFLNQPPPWQEIKTSFSPLVNRLRLALEDPSQQKLFRERILGKCEKKINGYMSSIPSGLMIRNAQALSEAVKDRSQEILRRLLRGDALEGALSAVRKTKFSFVGDKDPEGLLQSIFLSRKDDLEKANNLNQARDLVAALVFQLMSPSETDLSQNLFPTLTSLCERIKPPFLTDKTLTGSQQILTSWQSVKWPQYGAPIIAHELGHVVSRAIGDKDTFFPQIMSAIKKSHEEFYDFKDETSSLNNEEDFADFFSAQVMKDLEKSWAPVDNMGCLLLPIDGEREDFRPESLSFLKTSEESHSTGIFRLIQTQVLLGKEIPKSCQALPPVQRIMKGNERLSLLPTGKI
jgi:hypothetical protein